VRADFAADNDAVSGQAGWPRLMRMARRHWIASGWKALLRDVDLYALVGAAVTFTFLGVFGIADGKTLSSIVLALLALLAVSQVRMRIEQHSRASGRIGDYFTTDFPPDLQTSRDMTRRTYAYIGITGARTITAGLQKFREMLERGATLRFMLLDASDDQLVALASLLDSEKPDPERLRRRHAGALADLSSLRAKFGDRIEIRLLPTVPSYGINAIDIEQGDGSLYIQHYEFAAPGEASPHFKIAAADRYWFNHFVDELERLWDSSKSLI
jgi:hypothetical protein